MATKNFIPVIGYASSAAANQGGSEQAPGTLKTSAILQALNLPLHWQAILQTSQSVAKMAAIPEIANLCQQLANITLQLIKEKKPFVVIGGDHTSAIGTWSGAAAALNEKPLGLLWLDAHMDSHTSETTHTKNVHGMPLACLLGYGDKRLTHIINTKSKLLPQNVCLIGVRSYESEEAELLKKLKVHVYFMNEIEKRGLNEIMEEALSIINKNTAGYGISLDLDVITPDDAPGVSKPEKNGISEMQLLQALQQCAHDKKLLGLEIAEFNPAMDKEKKTEKLIAEIIETIYCFRHCEGAK